MTGLLALATVVVTVAVSVPLHTRLGRDWDEAAARRLVRTNWLRTGRVDGRHRVRRAARAGAPARDPVGPS